LLHDPAVRRFVLLSPIVLALGACSEEEGRHSPIFTTSSTTQTTADSAEGMDADGDGDGDGDDDPSTGDGDPTTSTGDGDGEAVCGNGIREGDEECDGNDLAGLDCTDFGYDDGILVCANDCKLFLNGCSTCGDGQLAATEACDGTNFGGQTCMDLGFAGGQLMCSADCSTIITTGCTAAAACGNGVIDANEECDGGNLGGQTCQSLGFDGGSLSCTAGCQFNTGNCTTNQCVGLFGECNVFLQDCCDGLVCFISCVPE
jgi:hypothetical protein